MNTAMEQSTRVAPEVVSAEDLQFRLEVVKHFERLPRSTCFVGLSIPEVVEDTKPRMMAADTVKMLCVFADREHWYYGVAEWVGGVDWKIANPVCLNAAVISEMPTAELEVVCNMCYEMPLVGLAAFRKLPMQGEAENDSVYVFVEDAHAFLPHPDGRSVLCIGRRSTIGRKGQHYRVLRVGGLQVALQ